MAKALIPGSFDPLHLGHLEVIETTARVFDEVVVACVGNPQKGSGIFDLAEREELVAASIAHLPNVTTAHWSGLVVDLARELDAAVIVKGLRGVSDFESEAQMAQMNVFMARIPTMFLPTAPQYGHLASRLIREIARLGGTVETMVPPPIARRLQELFPA